MQSKENNPSKVNITKPIFEPQEDNTFKIVFDPIYYGSLQTIRKISDGIISGEDAISRLTEILKKYPYHYQAAFVLSEIYNEIGDFEKACNVRYKACQKIMDMMPEGEDEDDQDVEIINLDWEDRENQYVMFLLQASAVDHLLIGDYEMSAGMLETLLEFDEEDHLNATKILAFCYVALGEEELYELIINDLNEKEAERYIIELWGGLKFKGAIDTTLLKWFKNNFNAVYKEFTADTHEADQNYLDDIESERPSKEARARLVWLQTESLWNEFPEFIDALKKG